MNIDAKCLNKIQSSMAHHYRITHGNQAHPRALFLGCKVGQNMKISQEFESRVGADVEKRESSCTFGGDVKWCNHYKKQ